MVTLLMIHKTHKRQLTVATVSYNTNQKIRHLMIKQYITLLFSVETSFSKEIHSLYSVLEQKKNDRQKKMTAD